MGRRGWLGGADPGSRDPSRAAHLIRWVFHLLHVPPNHILRVLTCRDGGGDMSQEGWGQALGSRWGRDRKEVVKGQLRASRGRCLLGPKSSGIVFGGSHGAYFS